MIVKDSEEGPPSFADSVDPSPLPDYDDGRSLALSLAESARSLTEREYTLETANGKPWAFLKVNCRPGSATSLPIFVQGETITGTVELQLEKTEHIHAVTIEARGVSVSAGQDPIPFLSQQTTLWSTSMGNPGTRSSGVGTAKLTGQYVWPFSIDLPDKVMAPSVWKGVCSEHPIPPSFSEKMSPCYLEYRLIVTFRRTRFRVDSTLSTMFGFLPRTHTPASSALRQLAYRENSAPPGPKEDLEGWEVLRTKSVTGIMFESRKVEVSCSFALAKPLCYTRGTFIPFSLTLGCSDDQALDLFAARGSIVIRLMRSLAYGRDALEESNHKPAGKTLMTRAGRGVSWLSSDNNNASDVRLLEGEIPLKRDLKASFVVPRLRLGYLVTVELKAPGFTAQSGNSGEPTFSREVVITTCRAPGPAPRSRIPPTLEPLDTEEDDESDTLRILSFGHLHFNFDD